VGHILARGDGEDARRKIEEARAAVAGGMDFLEAAQKFSEDPSVSQNKGDLGFIGRGQFVKPFEDRAFQMQIGEVSEPVRTQFGLHLIKLFEERSTAAVDCNNMDEAARNRFNDHVFQRQRADRLKDYLTKLRDKATIRVLN
jgi:parvulin-like peptidyl-prolyl isomerase